MKSVIIIGAAKSGYSEAITRRMINDGIFVIGTYDKEFSDNAKTLSDEFSSDKLTLQEVDLTSRDSMNSFIGTIKSNFDGLVFAQFFFDMENPDNFDHSIWDKSLAINLTAPNYLIHELKEKMNVDSSNIIITSTEAYRGSYGASAYSATKAGIHNLVKSLANTLGKRKIRVNALPSGWIGGEMDTDEIFNKSRELTPLGRLGDATEIANVVSFLFSKESSFINGTTLITDGGYLSSDPLSKYEFDDLNK
jgi:NAD(P)-dependent dehydrogenase (short-subunit alcohol dehydrogenase family)